MVVDTVGIGIADLGRVVGVNYGGGGGAGGTSSGWLLSLVGVMSLLVVVMRLVVVGCGIYQMGVMMDAGGNSLERRVWMRVEVVGIVVTTEGCGMCSASLPCIAIKRSTWHCVPM